MDGTDKEGEREAWKKDRRKERASWEEERRTEREGTKMGGTEREMG